MKPFASFLQAGFECAVLPFGVRDLLTATRHVPGQRLASHYAQARRLGLTTIRDGLPWSHDARPRLVAAQEAGVEAIWDICHFDPPPDPVGHALRLVEDFAHVCPPEDTVWVCPMNEPSICPTFRPHFSRFELAQAGVDMLVILKHHLPDVRCLTTDPIVGAGEDEYAATDLMVSTGLVDVVGVNYYPHTAVAPLRDVLLATWRRYGLPVLLSETSWHVGHPEHDGRFFGHDKAAWLAHVLSEIRRAQASGAKVVGCCWYPVVSCPAWDGSGAIWDHGLIGADASVDDELARAMQGYGRAA